MLKNSYLYKCVYCDYKNNNIELMVYHFKKHLKNKIGNGYSISELHRILLKKIEQEYFDKDKTTNTNEDFIIKEFKKMSMM